MPGYVALPAYRAPSAINFDPLNQGLDDLSKQFEKNRLLRQAQQVGAALAPDTAVPTTPNPLMAPQSAPASPAQASAAAAGRDFPNLTSGTDYSPAIKGIESGGNYKAVGPVTASGDRAYGAHQVMGANIPAWTKEVLGQSLTPQQYLDNPDAQEKVFRAKFGQFVAKTGNPQDAASMWFTGKPLAQGANRRDLYGTSGSEYVNRFNAASGGTPGATAQAQAAPAPSGPNYRAAAAKAFEFGNVALGTQLLQQQSELDNQAYMRGRQAKQDVREEQTFKDAHLKAVAAHVGNMANTVALEPDKAKQTAMWRSMVATDPEIVQGLQQNGIDPNDVESGTRFMINQARGITDKLGKDRYVVVGKRLYDTATQQFINSPDGAAGEDAKYGKQIVYGIDEQGNQIPMQAGDNATLAPSKLPPGVKIGGKTPIRLDAGDKWILLDPVTRATIGEVSKNVAAEANQKEIGKLSADAQAALPAAKTSVDDAVLMVNRLRTHPGLDVATGLSSVADPRNFTPGSDAYNFNVLNKQEVSKTFMAAREGLKGAGQVTDFEGNKGQDAIGRLNTAQSKPAYLEALDDVERMMKSSYSDLEKKAGLVSSGRRSDQPAPQTGGDPALKQKYGLE